ncbi:MAG: DUF2927 domain-containing protein [Bacillota bacterium]|nr:DUF2927 domain-containing protein [Bacillota bacterium]
MLKKISLIIVSLLLCFLLSSCMLIFPPDASPSAAPSESASPSASPVESISPQQALEYFSIVALQSEYGGGSSEGIVRRWERPIIVEVRGQPTVEDMDTLTAHLNMLNDIEGMPDITITEEAGSGNYIINFVPLDDMGTVIPSYVEDNWGYVSLSWDSNSRRITKANVAIATDVTNQIRRNHLILEEVTQGLGLLNDSPLYQDSIYQIDWTETQQLSQLDYLIIEMLYSPAVYAGMHQADAESALEEWLGSSQ